MTTWSMSPGRLTPDQAAGVSSTARLSARNASRQHPSRGAPHMDDRARYAFRELVDQRIARAQDQHTPALPGLFDCPGDVVEVHRVGDRGIPVVFERTRDRPIGESELHPAVAPGLELGPSREVEPRRRAHAGGNAERPGEIVRTRSHGRSRQGRAHEECRLGPVEKSAHQAHRLAVDHRERGRRTGRDRGDCGLAFRARLEIPEGLRLEGRPWSALDLPDGPAADPAVLAAAAELAAAAGAEAVVFPALARRHLPLLAVAAATRAPGVLAAVHAADRQDARSFLDTWPIDDWDLRPYLDSLVLVEARYPGRRPIRLAS